MFSVGAREIALSRRNPVNNGRAENNQTLNIEAGVGPAFASDVLVANLETRRAVGRPPPLPISSKFRFGGELGCDAGAHGPARTRLRIRSTRAAEQALRRCRSRRLSTRARGRCHQCRVGRRGAARVGPLVTAAPPGIAEGLGDVRDTAERNATGRADRHGRPSAPAMQHSGGAGLLFRVSGAVGQDRGSGRRRNGDPMHAP